MRDIWENRINMKRRVIDIETTGLQPVKEDHRILAIGLDDVIIMHQSEKRTLEEFWESLEPYDRLVTFNGTDFDIWFIVVRSIKHRIPIKKFSSLDLRRLLGNGNWSVKGTLNDYCKVFGIADDDDHDGSEMVELGRKWLDGDNEAGERIREHLTWCLRKTSELYGLLKEVRLAE